MKSGRTLFILGIVAVLIPSGALAADPVKNALTLIPENALAFLCVPSMKQLDADLAKAITDLGLEQVVPPGMLSAQALLSQRFGVSEGVDSEGALSVMLLPLPKAEGDAPPAYGAMPFEIGFIVPSTDPQMMLSSMGAQAGEGSTWSMELAGQPFYAKPKGNSVVLTKRRDITQAASADGASITKQMKPEELKVLGGQDVVLWLNCKELFTQLRPQIEGFTNMMIMMQTASNPQAMGSAQNMKEQLNMFFDGARSAVVGAALDPQGLGLRFFMTSRAGTEMAKQLKLVKTSGGSLLGGLPDDKYLLAAGMHINPEATKQSLKYFSGMFEQLAADPEQTKNKETLGQLSSQLEEGAVLVTGARASVSSLAGGADGMLGAAMVLDVQDTGKVMELCQKMFKTIKTLDPGEDLEAKQLLAALAYKPDAEELSGAKVQRLTLDLSKVEEAEEEDIEDLHKVIGEEGVLVRIAAVNDQRVVISFGGGSTYAERVIEQARGNDAPLAKDAGIKRVREHLPERKAGEFYLAADRVVDFVRQVQKVLEEEQLPVELPVIDAPLAIASTGGEDWALSELYLPTELMNAGKQFAMVMMGTAGQGSEVDPAAGSPGPMGQ